MKIRISIMAALCAAALGCGDDTPEAKPANAAKPAAAKPGAAGAAAAAPTKPEIVSTVQYSYNPVSKRDPFRSPDEVRIPKGPAGGEAVSGCNEPLCKWDLEQLSLVAVVTGDANPIAMLEDPQGRGYIVKRNTRVGKLGGKVSNILRDQITVTEYWTQPNGESKPIQKPVKIKEEKGFVPEMDLLTGKMVGERNE